MIPGEKKRWLDEPRNVRKIVWGLVSACAGLFFADALYHKHAHSSWEGWFGFYALYGFVACVALVLAAKQLRKVVKRDDDYYDR